MTNLPSEHQPKGLRRLPFSEPPRRAEAFAVGYEMKPNEFGMTAGPWPKLETALNFIPDVDRSHKARIIRFNVNGTGEVLYFWRSERWILNKEGSRG